MTGPERGGDPSARGVEDTEARPGSGLPVGDLPERGRRTTGLSVPARVLAVGAHPDDIEFGCGATLARWSRQGCRVHHLVLTDGSKGSWEAGADRSALAATREEECRAAAAVLDGTLPTELEPDRVLFLGEIDGELENEPSARRGVVTHLRRLRPDVVLTHDPWRRYRLHPDHRAAGFLVLDAVVAARDPLFFPEVGPGSHRPSAILLFEADEPNHVEDADEFIDVKVEALLRHRSQHQSTMDISTDATGVDLDRTVTGFAARVRRQLSDHGALAGLAAGEAFHLIDTV